LTRSQRTREDSSEAATTECARPRRDSFPADLGGEPKGTEQPAENNAAAGGRGGRASPGVSASPGGLPRRPPAAPIPFGAGARPKRNARRPAGWLAGPPPTSPPPARSRSVHESSSPSARHGAQLPRPAPASPPTSSVRPSHPPIPRRAGRPANRNHADLYSGSVPQRQQLAKLTPPSLAGSVSRSNPRPAPTDGADPTAAARPDGTPHASAPLLHVPRRVRHGPRAGAPPLPSPSFIPSPPRPPRLASPRPPPHIYPPVRPSVSTRRRERGGEKKEG